MTHLMVESVRAVVFVLQKKKKKKKKKSAPLLCLEFAVIYKETMILFEKKVMWKMVKSLLAERNLRLTNYTEYDDIHFMSYALIIV
jgi:hypothetical protein